MLLIWICKCRQSIYARSVGKSPQKTHKCSILQQLVYYSIWTHRMLTRGVPIASNCVRKLPSRSSARIMFWRNLLSAKKMLNFWIYPSAICIREMIVELPEEFQLSFLRCNDVGCLICKTIQIVAKSYLKKYEFALLRHFLMEQVVRFHTWEIGKAGRSFGLPNK